MVDGHKSGLNPHTVHALPGSSNMIVLDSSGSTFYTTSFPMSVGKKPTFFYIKSMNRVCVLGLVGFWLCV